MSFRDIGIRVRTVIRLHIRSRSFSWRRRGLRLWWSHNCWQQWVKCDVCAPCVLGPQHVHWLPLNIDPRVCSPWPGEAREKTKSGQENLIWFYWWSAAKLVQIDASLVRTANSPDSEVGLNNRLIGAITVLYPVILFLVTHSTFSQHNTK